MAEKKYYWLKLQDSFFGKEIKLLRRIAGGDTYTIIYLKMLLLSLKNEGKIFYEGVCNSVAEEISLDIDEDTENVAITIAYLEQKGMLEFITDNEMFLNETPTMIGQETDAAERMRKSRERQRENQKKQLESNVVTENRNNVTEISNSVQAGYKDVTDELRTVTNSSEKLLYIDTETKKELELKTETEKKKKTPAEAEASLGFEDFWSAYPKKTAKKLAETAFKKIKPSQKLIARMIDTIEAFKKSEQWSIEGGRFIPNPTTWLNGGRWDDEIPASATTAIKAEGSMPDTNNPFLKKLWEMEMAEKEAAENES